MSFGSSPVLGPISFQLDKGQRLALTGPSGVGKSTLLRIIAGLETGFAGRCEFDGVLSMVFQEPNLLPWRSAVQNVTLATGVGADEAEAALSEVGLGGLGQRLPEQLSLGQQRRLSLARALAVKPDLVLLDEPFVSLDEGLATEMIELTDRLLQAAGAAAILVTHAMDEAERLAPRRLVLSGTPATAVERGADGASL